MSFKKYKLNKKSILFINVIGFTAIILVGILGYLLLKNINIISFNLPNKDQLVVGVEGTKKYDDIINIGKNTSNNIKQKTVDKNITKEKEKSNKINILVLGRGGGDHDAPNLTDTIILANIDLDNKYINLLSIPRDLYVEYNENESAKINGIYAETSFKTNSKKKGINAIESKISEITGEKIDYFINVDFKGFRSIIDTIGGIKINVPTNFVDTRYPDGNWGYKTLTFKKGTWLFDGESALKYARSRHSTSDFDRSMRQQQVIESIKDKITGTYFLKSPGKIKELYEVFINNLDTDLNLTTIFKLAYSISGDGYTITNSNINDSCFYGSDNCEKGGFLYVPERKLFSGMSVLLMEGTNKQNLNNYTKSIKFTDLMFNNPEFIKENYKVNIFNSLKVNFLAGTISNDIKKFGFNISDKNSIGNTDVVYSKSVIYYNNIKENSATIKILKTFFNGKFIKIDSPKYSKNNANIEIIIGEDYLGKKKIFKF